MSRLVALYGDDAQLEKALNALQAAGLADKMRVLGGGAPPPEAEEAEAHRAADLRAAARADDVPGADQDLADTPAVVPGTGGAPPVSPAVLDPLAVPAGGSSAVGVVGPGPGEVELSREVERITGGDADEARFYTEAVDGGASLLVVEGDDEELDRSEAALAGNEGQGMVRR